MREHWAFIYVQEEKLLRSPLTVAQIIQRKLILNNLLGREDQPASVISYPIQEYKKRIKEDEKLVLN